MTTVTVLTPEQIDHLWDTRVGEPSSQHPLDTADKLQFARAIEQAVLQSAEVQRLRDALEDVSQWMDSQADTQSKGGHATFDIMMLREKRDIARSALAAMEKKP